MTIPSVLNSFHSSFSILSVGTAGVIQTVERPAVSHPDPTVFSMLRNVRHGVDSDRFSVYLKAGIKTMTASLLIRGGLVELAPNALSGRLQLARVAVHYLPAPIGSAVAGTISGAAAVHSLIASLGGVLLLYNPSEQTLRAATQPVSEDGLVSRSFRVISAISATAAAVEMAALLWQAATS